MALIVWILCVEQFSCVESYLNFTICCAAVSVKQKWLWKTSCLILPLDLQGELWIMRVQGEQQDLISGFKIEAQGGQGANFIVLN